MATPSIFRICALLAVCELAAGCSETSFGGSGGRIRDTKDAEKAPGETPSEVRAPEAGEDESGADLQVDEEEFDSAASGTYQTVELSVTTELVAAPAVRLEEIEVFNGAVYLRLECEALHPEHGDCQDSLDPNGHYALFDLGLALAAVTDQKDGIPSSYEDLLQVDAQRQVDSRELEPGVLEVGPLAIPEIGDQQTLAVVVRHTPADSGNEMSSFKLFVASGREDTP